MLPAVAGIVTAISTIYGKYQNARIKETTVQANNSTTALKKHLNSISADRKKLMEENLEGLYRDF